MRIEVRHQFFRQPGSDILSDGCWGWSAVYRSPLRGPHDYSPGSFFQGCAATPWEAIGKLVVKVMRGASS